MEQVLAASSVCHLLHYRRGDAVDDNASPGLQHLKHLGYDFLQFAAMATDEHSIGTRQVDCIGLQKISYMHIYSWCAETTAVVAYQFLTILTYLECHHLQMGEQQPCPTTHVCPTGRVPAV